MKTCTYVIILYMSTTRFKFFVDLIFLEVACLPLQFTQHLKHYFLFFNKWDWKKIVSFSFDINKLIIILQNKWYFEWLLYYIKNMSIGVIKFSSNKQTNKIKIIFYLMQEENLKNDIYLKNWALSIPTYLCILRSSSNLNLKTFINI